MENVHLDTCELIKAAELEHIEYLITGGKQLDEILTLFPQYDKCAINEIVKRVTWFCFMSEDEANTRTINGKDYVVKAVFRDGGEDIKSTIMKLAERKTIREMGLDVPVENS